MDAPESPAENAGADQPLRSALGGLLGATLVFLGLAALFGALGARTLRNQPRVLQGSLQQLCEDQRRAGDG